MLFHFIFLTWFFDSDIKRDVMYENYRWPLSIVVQLFSYCSTWRKEENAQEVKITGYEEVGGLKAREDACSTTEWLFHSRCSLGSLGSLPCQKNVHSSSLGLPLEATLATMSMLSRNHRLVADHRRGQDTLS